MHILSGISTLDPANLTLFSRRECYKRVSAEWRVCRKARAGGDSQRGFLESLIRMGLNSPMPPHLTEWAGLAAAGGRGEASGRVEASPRLPRLPPRCRCYRRRRRRRRLGQLPRASGLTGSGRASLTLAGSEEPLVPIAPGETFSHMRPRHSETASLMHYMIQCPFSEHQSASINHLAIQLIISYRLRLTAKLSSVSLHDYRNTYKQSAPTAPPID